MPICRDPACQREAVHIEAARSAASDDPEDAIAYCALHKPNDFGDFERGSRRTQRAEYASRGCYFVQRMLASEDPNPGDGSWGKAVVAQLHQEFGCPPDCGGHDPDR